MPDQILLSRLRTCCQSNLSLPVTISENIFCNLKIFLTFVIWMIHVKAFDTNLFKLIFILLLLRKLLK